MNNFWSTLFEPGEATCFSPDKYGTSLAVEPNNRAVFFSLNAMHTARADANVTSYRNILVEMDSVPLEDQIPYIQSIDMPWSTITYSGSKSYHFIISLYEPCANRADYDELVDRIYTAVGKDKLDTKCKNPSRLSRVPGAIRPDTGLEQKLYKVFYRVPRADLEAWLTERIPDYKRKEYRRPLTGKFKPIPKGTTTHFIMFGAPKGEWNNALFTAACDLFRCGFSRDQVEHKLSKPTGHLDRHDLKTIESAETTVSREING